MNAALTFPPAPILNRMCEWITTGITVEEVAYWFVIAATFLAFIKVPYSIYALFVYNKDPKIRAATQNVDHAINSTAFNVKVNLWGTLILLVNFTLRTYAHIEPTIQNAPDWSYLMSMVATTSILVILWAPSIRLLTLKNKLLGQPLLFLTTDKRRRVD